MRMRWHFPERKNGKAIPLAGIEAGAPLKLGRMHNAGSACLHFCTACGRALESRLGTILSDPLGTAPLIPRSRHLEFFRPTPARGLGSRPHRPNGLP